MPLYHYICDECKKDFELRHKYGEKGILCSHCESPSVSRFLGKKVNVSVKQSNNVSKNKVGYEVNKAIDDGKRELEKTKKTLSKERKKDE